MSGWSICTAGLFLMLGSGAAGATNTIRSQLHSLTLVCLQTRDGRPPIVAIDPPEKGFFAKRLDFKGIPIKAAKEVEDQALQVAYDRLEKQMAHLPNVPINLAAAGAELHIIGRNQVTTDLPEWRHDKGKPLAEYKGLTRDQRTRGMGGLLASCGEENLLRLPSDRYRGRDICVHEFAHNILSYGVPREIRQRFEAQRRRSFAQGLWVGSYAGSNVQEFFAELTMWYFGTRGDLHMKGPKPENGPEGLKKYDPEAFALFDEFYRGKIDIPRIERRARLMKGRESDISMLCGSTHSDGFEVGSRFPRGRSFQFGSEEEAQVFTDNNRCFGVCQGTAVPDAQRRCGVGIS
jgi:hypothetical protein